MAAHLLWLWGLFLAFFPGDAPGKGLTIVVMGDGAAAPQREVESPYPARLARRLGDRGLGVVVINRGVEGNTPVQARKQFEEDVLVRGPDLVVIHFGRIGATGAKKKGGLEAGGSPETFEKHLSWFVDTLRSRGAEAILVTPLPSPGGRGPDPAGDPGTFAEAVRAVAKKKRVPLLDAFRLFETYEDQGLLLREGVPNDRGHALLARMIADLVIARTWKGYTLPLVDLAGETKRQVVVDREKGQYLGHPTTVLLEDGKTLLCVYPKGHGRGAIVMKRSTDGGRTWSDRLPVPESWKTSKEVPTLYRVVDPEGRKRLLLFSGLYPIRMACSEDDGRTWSELEPIGDFGGIVAMASLVPIEERGCYMALFHDDGRFLRGKGKVTRFRVYKTVTRDGGRTWSEPEVIAEHPLAHLCEPGAIRSPDGKEIAVLLRENSRRFNSFVIFSRDEGRTWTEPRQLRAALTGDRHMGRYGPDGRLFIAFRDTTRESPTQGDWAGWVGTYEDIRNDREGRYRVRIMDNRHAWDCAYPGVEVLPDGTFVTTTYGHWTEGEPPYIVSVRFHLSELDEKAKALEKKGRGEG